MSKLLNFSEQKANSLEADIISKLLKEKKLILILDIDNTILHSSSIARLRDQGNGNSSNSTDGENTATLCNTTTAEDTNGSAIQNNADDYKDIVEIILDTKYTKVKEKINVKFRHNLKDFLL